MPARPTKLFKLFPRVHLRGSEAFRRPRSVEPPASLEFLAFSEAFDEAGKAPFNKDAADPRDEDVAFFYAEEANHDAEDAIFEELYGTSTTTVPPPGW